VDDLDLEQRRELLGMTRAELAAWLAVPTQTISGWETGRYRIPHPRILDLALDRLEAIRDDTTPRARERAVFGGASS
jgi:transcriptional regulator with XRE-family HTH domain